MFDLDTSLDTEAACVDRAIQLLEKATAGIEPELFDSSSARAMLERFDRVRRLGDYGVAAFARKVDDAAVVSRATGTSVGQAKATVALGKDLKAAPELGAALAAGVVSAEQAKEIASAEASVRGITEELVKTAASEPFHVFKDKARKMKLEAEQHNGLS